MNAGDEWKWTWGTAGMMQGTTRMLHCPAFKGTVHALIFTISSFSIHFYTLVKTLRNGQIVCFPYNGHVQSSKSEEGLGQHDHLRNRITCRLQRNALVEHNCSLDGTLVLHGLETLGPLLQLESLVDDTLDLDLTAVCSWQWSANG